jgi:integrase
MKLTNTTIKQMQYRKASNKADLRFDDELRGFGVRVYPSGRKSFFISYRNASGTKKRHTLGDFGSLTATKARGLAQDELANVRKGTDPQADRQANRHQMTFNILAERYLHHHEGRKKSLKADHQRLRDHIRPVIGPRKLSEITLAQLERLQRKIRDKTSPATANRCVALMKHIFTTAGKWGLLDVSPARHLSMFREPPSRDIVLKPDECRRILEACDADENIFAAALFKLAMFTGRRTGELLSLKWDDIDLENYRATLQDTKANERQFIILNETAAAIFRALPHLEGNPYVIAGAAKGKPLNFYVRAWRRILKRAEVNYFPPHGLRHNYVSMLIAAGEPPDVVGHLVGHKSSITTRKYLHHMPDNLRRTTDKLANVINFNKENRSKKA